MSVGLQQWSLYLSAILLLGIPCKCSSQVGEEYRATIWPIVDVLRSGYLSGSLEYWGRCGDESVTHFPMTITPANPSAPPLQVLREMFANDPMMRITLEEPNDIVRMAETDIPQDLLNVKITHLSFDEENKRGFPMYFPANVLSFITHAPEVQAFMNDHGIELTPTMINEASSTSPRVSGELNNVTLSEALDYMLKTFPGLWVYENCTDGSKSKRGVVFSFYRNGQGPADHPMPPK
jgi:hypothetical protein